MACMTLALWPVPDYPQYGEYCGQYTYTDGQYTFTDRPYQSLSEACLDLEAWVLDEYQERAWWYYNTFGAYEQAQPETVNRIIRPRREVSDIAEECVPTPRSHKRVLGENEHYVHKIDWERDPPTWAGEEIPRMPIDEVAGYLQEKYKINKETRCRFDDCERVFGAGGLKNHVLSEDHIALRTTCRACEFACRPDMFNTVDRHPKHHAAFMAGVRKEKRKSKSVEH